MIKDTPHKYLNIMLSEWLSKLPNNLDVDDVAIWQIVPVGRDDFGLKDKELSEFAYVAILSLLKRGAIPVAPCEGEIGLSKIEKYVGEPEHIANIIVSDLNLNKIDADDDSIWFSKFA